MKIYLDALARIPTVSIGTQAFIISSMQIIKKHLGNVEFILLSCHEQMEHYYCDPYNLNIKIVHRNKSQLGTIKNILDITKDVDVVVSPWGDGYISVSPYNIFHKAFFLKLRRKPLVLFPSSIGPFGGGLKRFMAKKGLQLFDALMARDTITYNYLNDLKLKNVFLIPDSAFVLEPSGKSRVEEIFAIENVPKANTYIGFSVSQLLNHLFKIELNKNYGKFISEIVLYLMEYFNAHILLIPHQIYPKCCGDVDDEILSSRDGDDRYAIRKVMETLKGNKNVTPILGEYNPSEYKGIIGASTIFIGGRMHAVIGATSQGIPSIIMQYSHKAPGVMNTLGLGKYVWDIASSKEELIRMIDDIWINKEDLNKSIAEKSINIKNEAWNSGKILKEVLERSE